MQISELLIKKKPKKKKVLKEVSLTPASQKPVNIGGVDFTPPFYAFGNELHDVNKQPLCQCNNVQIAKGLADILTESCCSVEMQ